MAQLPRKDAAPYEDTNDVERLAADPTVRMVGSRERRETGVALTSARHWVDTDVRTEERNDQGLARLNTDLVQHEAARPLTRRPIPDIDSSERPVHGGAHEQSAYNGHVESVC
jgi:hypothetical protein